MSDNSIRQPDERQRALKAVDLRVQGHTYAQIAERLDYSDESGARHAVSRLLARREAESVDELRAVHGARLEAVLSSFWAAATSGDTDAARIVLRTLDSLAKLYGLDAPTRVAVGSPVSAVEFAEEAARLIDSIVSLGGADDLLRSLPGNAGQAVLGARESAALPEGDDPAAQDSSLSGAHSAETVPDDDEPWSNIGGPDPVPVAPRPERVSDVEPQPAEADPMPDEAEPVPQRMSLAHVLSRRVTDRYDPLAGWNR